MLLFTSNTGSITEQVDALKDVADAAENVGDTLIHFNVQDFIPTILNIGIKILVILLIWFVGKKLTNIVIRFFEKSAERHGLDISVASFVSILIKWAMYFLIACTILNYLNIGTASLVAVLGSAGIAIGLALQGSLTNFAGSVILLIMKPFGIGDYIVSPQGEGTVKLIGLIYTTLTTVDNKEVHIPNGSLANSNITNVSANPTRVVMVKVGISYDSDLKKAKDLFYKLLETCEYRIADTDIKVFVSDLGASSVDLEGRCTVAAADYWTATWFLREQIKLIYDQAGIEIPFAQVDVHMK